MSEAVWRRYRSFLRRPPLLVFRWHDAPTGACGWLVLESLRGGAAGGGTRMRVGLDRREVVYLAKTMELKFAVAGPPIGGAKAGLRFDPQDPRRGDVLRRFYDALVPWLRSRYGTGGDLHIDEVADVLPATRAVGLAHPQEGVLRGHFGLDGPALDAAVDRLRHGLENPVPPPLGPAPGWPAADLVTGYTVARAVRELYGRWGADLRGRTVAVEGVGTVGAAAAWYLAAAGARIVALADDRATFVAPSGLDSNALERLLSARVGKRLPPGPNLCPGHAALDDSGAEIFVAAAASGTLTAPRMRRLAARGTRVLACGANQPFAERGLGATSLQRAADRRFAVLPDVVANCGMARALAHLMAAPTAPSPAGLFTDLDATVARALPDGARRHGLLAATLDRLLDAVAA